MQSRYDALAIDVAGHLDLCGPELVEGWMFWASHPNARFSLDVLIDGKQLGQCEANLFRADLKEAGYGDGCCAFTFSIPASLTVRDFSTTRVRVRGSSLHLIPDDATTICPAAVRYAAPLLKVVRPGRETRQLGVSSGPAGD